MVKILDFFVSGQTCGQTEELMIFRHSGEPKKSVFSRVFGTFRKIYAERGDGVPNQKHFLLRCPKNSTALRLILEFFDRCHTLCLVSSATGSTRQRFQTEPHPENCITNLFSFNSRFHSVAFSKRTSCCVNSKNCSVIISFKK